MEPPDATTADRPDETPGEVEPLNIFFRLTILPAAALVITALALVAVQSGDPTAPINFWLARYGGLMIACEVGLCLLFGLVALASDRRRIEERRQREAERVDGAA